MPAFAPFPAVTCTTPAPSITKRSRHDSKRQISSAHGTIRVIAQARFVPVPGWGGWHRPLFWALSLVRQISFFLDGGFLLVSPACKWATSLQYFMSRAYCARTYLLIHFFPCPGCFPSHSPSHPTGVWFGPQNTWCKFVSCTLPLNEKITYGLWNCVLFWWHKMPCHKRPSLTLPRLAWYRNPIFGSDC